MKLGEYQSVKNMTYLQYCDYLQSKYGIGLSDYMSPSFKKLSSVTRTGEGLIAHHKAEDKAPLLSQPEIAARFPFEWQKKENIVYCDLLEHLLLHVKICMYPSPDKIDGMEVGIGGVINFLVPELNDLYSGYQAKQAWQKNCYDLVADDEEVYLAILKDFIDYKRNDPEFGILSLFSSYHEQFGAGWNRKKNERIFTEILNIYNGRSGDE